MKSIGSRWMKALLVFLAILVLYVPGVLLAAEEEQEKESYAGLDINIMALNAGGDTYTPINMRAKIGLIMFPDLIPVLAFESHFGFGLTEASSNDGGNNDTVKVGNYVGFYARASYEIEDVINFYGLLGAATAQLHGDTDAVGSDTQSGISVGFGAGFGLPYDLEGNIELMELVTGKNFDIYMLSFGVSYKF